MTETTGTMKSLKMVQIADPLKKIVVHSVVLMAFVVKTVMKDVKLVFARIHAKTTNVTMAKDVLLTWIQDQVINSFLFVGIQISPAIVHQLLPIPQDAHENATMMLTAGKVTNVARMDVEWFASAHMFLMMKFMTLKQKSSILVMFQLFWKKFQKKNSRLELLLVTKLF